MYNSTVNSGSCTGMSIARLRARFVHVTNRKLYDRIYAVGSRTQRDELLVMAQRAELR